MKLSELLKKLVFQNAECVILDFLEEAIAEFLEQQQIQTKDQLESVLQKDVEQYNFAVDYERFFALLVEYHFITRFKVGTTALGQYYEDGEWYKCTIQEIKQETYVILFDDYGNQESVGFDQVRHLEESDENELLDKEVHESKIETEDPKTGKKAVETNESTKKKESCLAQASVQPAVASKNKQSIASGNEDIEFTLEELEFDDDIDDPPVQPQFEEPYFKNGFWEKELDILKMRNWNPGELASFLKELQPRKGWKSKFKLKMMDAITNTIEAENLTGELFLSYPRDFLVSKVLKAHRIKEGSLKSFLNEILKILNEKNEEVAGTYIERLERHSRLCHMVVAEWRGSALGGYFQQTLKVHPRHAIRYCVVERISRFDVPKMDKNVTKACSVTNSEMFKVVSFTGEEKPNVVSKNVIYVKNREKRAWEVIASVDFAQHGQGNPSGHWHLNRTPDGDIMAHWGLSISKIFHGAVDCCPFWWHLIPEGYSYPKGLRPERKMMMLMEEEF